MDLSTSDRTGTYYYNYYGAGAGGSLLCDVGEISGSGTIQANGGNALLSSDMAGAGGRVSIQYATDSGTAIADLTIEAKPGTFVSSAESYAAAPGTVYIKSAAQQFGDLRIDEGGNGHAHQTTTLRSVGSRLITAVDPVSGEANRYRVTVDNSSSTGWMLPGSGPEQNGIRGLFVSLDSNPDNTLYEIVDNGADYLIVESAEDLKSYVGATLQGVIRLDSLKVSENGHLVTDDLLYVDNIEISNLGNIEDVPNLLTGGTTVFDELVIENETRFFVTNVETRSLTINGGGLVTRGELTVTSGDLVVRGDVEMRSEVMARAVTVAGKLDAENALIKVDGTLNVAGNLGFIDNNTLSATTVKVGGNLNLTGAYLELAVDHNVTVGGDVSLVRDDYEMGSVMTVPDADETAEKFFSLQMDIVGKLSLEEGSRIDLDGKGYPGRRTVGFAQTPVNQGGSHAGMGGLSTVDASYGDFRQIFHAGGGGYYTAGGGLVRLHAGEIELQGSAAIRANGGTAASYSGAGGGIEIETATLSGTGFIEAQGGRASYPTTGAGGRISITCNNIGAEMLAAEHISARGGESGAALGALYTGGAGTVFLRDSNNDTGRLFIDNGPAGSTRQWTPLRSVGRHEIVSAVDLGNDRLRVEVSGTPWQAPAGSRDGLGLIGLQVDLLADDEDGPYYDIVDNGENWLLLDTATISTGTSPQAGDALIGVIRLQSLRVAGGARMKTSDRLMLADAGGLELTGNSGLSFGQLENWEDYTWTDGTELLLTGDQTVTSLDLDGVDITIDGALNVSGDVDLRGTNTLQALALSVGGDLVLTGAELELAVDQPITVLGDVFLVANANNYGSVITVPDADSVAEKVFALDMDIIGTLTIDDVSRIDLTGKGYPIRTTVGFASVATQGGSYGGMGGVAAVDETYGDYRHITLAGGGGYGSAGGGLIRLHAGGIDLQGSGSIRANGLPASNYTGAGGGIVIETNALTGSGFVEAQGGQATSSRSGSGGRISIAYQSIAAELLAPEHISARAGDSSSTSGTADTGGAGTIFLHDKVAGAEHLLIDNGPAGLTSQWTPLRTVGQHSIADYQLLDGDQVRIEVSGSPWTSPAESLDGLGLIGLKIDLQADDQAGPYFTVVDNGPDWLVINSGGLPLPDLTGLEIIGVVQLDSLQIRNGATFYSRDRLELEIQTGLAVDGDTVLAFGQLEGWTDHPWPQEYSLLIASDQRLENLGLTGVNVIIEGHLEVTDWLAFAGAVDAPASLEAKSITCGGDFDVQHAVITCTDITVGGNIHLLDGAELTVPDADISTKTVYPLSLSTPGSLYVQDGAKINLDSKGYPPRSAGPDGNLSVSSFGAHGGLCSSGTTDGSYGRFQEAMFAGAGAAYSYQNNARGGGRVKITANNLVLAANGLISANGGDSTAGGAGGGIHMDIATDFSGSGKLSAWGGNSTTSSTIARYCAGGGGRISIDVAPENDHFSGILDASGGSFNNGSSKFGGAGTVYLGSEANWDNGQWGSLIVQNSYRGARSGSTPLRTVGRHQIIDAEALGGGRWKVYAGIPGNSPNIWRANDPPLGWGIAGNFIDLDADTTDGPFYKIVDNGWVDCTIEDPEGHISDAQSLIGRTFIGVHRFETIDVLGGASVDFGEDRVFVMDPDNSAWDIDSEIISDSASVLPVKK